MKFDEARLDRMNPYSKQYQDQLDRILYGNNRVEDKSIFKEVMDADSKREREGRRLVRAMHWRMQQG
ncbi:MAG: hypothetical protein FIB08_07555 [Candidatus Methanoperedens sp.]|nr:hypothetical protein [Candidatus Methanoperedens sp.]